MDIRIAKDLDDKLRDLARELEVRPGVAASQVLREGLADPDRPLLTEGDVEKGLAGMGPLEHTRVLGQILAARDRRLEEDS